MPSSCSAHIAHHPEDLTEGVTLNAAWSLRLEDEVGSIAPGKRANFTVLSEDPLAVDPVAIRDIEVWGTVMEGRVLPAGGGRRRASRAPADTFGMGREQFALSALRHAAGFAHGTAD